ncbi:MAG: 3'-phosphoesterase [Bacteroidia bacterium]|nr:3'-phosphoesterase [Bacteroidia bacterium]
MSLVKYKQKRNFGETSEPEGEKRSSGKKLEFVVLHYDFRLEMDGVLKSWAIPKGPSINSSDKRLAMMVGDHPFEYRKFSGNIPEGNYGAGIVEIWDHGTYIPEDEERKVVTEKQILKDLKAGVIKFSLKGKKLKGSFALVKMKKAESNFWLMIKHKDEFSVLSDYNSEDFTVKSSPINKALKKKAE